MGFQDYPFWQVILFYLLTVWAYIWKAIALWRASKLGQRNWFIAILVLNTIGLLEVIYLFRFAKKRMTIKEIKDFFQNLKSYLPAAKKSK